ncbi:LytR/AlgR family response regulator transcription factor [Dyadobacter diqingensis]|uniref:LytR/AlgR family response regulator transcription factor n=1 Tax=Dyadobacter diqingensis TaxID=2938121 RepID=UPI0020C20DE8|nr:LytTR family DNA-binding domain-containing protein [Dyadobacter diqingensis]
MRQYKCLIVDDEPIAREIIETFCSHYPSLRIIGLCENAIEAKQILLEQTVDILFLDIDMPELDGISFLKTIKISPQVIFTTAYKEFALDAFELSACDYLLKPIPLNRFMVAVEKAMERLQQTGFNSEKPDDFVFIKTQGKIFKVAFDDLLYAEASGKKVKVVTGDETLLASLSFTALELLLPQALFLRVHRSFIINKSRISYLEGNRIFIGKHEIPIGEFYRESLFKTLGLTSSGAENK